MNPPEKVLELACERLGETKYHPLLGNCEHFCTECKIGKSISIQVNEQRCRPAKEKKPPVYRLCTSSSLLDIVAFDPIYVHSNVIALNFYF